MECETFTDLIEALDADPATLGVMAIENTIAGSLLHNLELLRQARTHRVVGEIKMRISHALCALPGQAIGDICQVHSHHMALLQCDRFLRSHPSMKAVEAFDTAGAARQVAREGSRGVAAIAPALAAGLYGLEVLAEGIETSPRNFTRFLLLAHPEAHKELVTPPGDVDKASVAFVLPHRQGALSSVLSIFTFYDINLSSIQSMPIVGREWEYRFYADLTFDSPERYRQALDAVRPLTTQLQILGEYRACRAQV